MVSPVNNSTVLAVSSFLNRGGKEPLTPSSQEGGGEGNVAKARADETKIAAEQRVDGVSDPKTTKESDQAKRVGEDRTPPEQKDVSNAVDDLNNFIQSMTRELRFSVDKESGRTVIKVMDSKGEVIRQIPPEDVVKLAKSLQDLKSSLGILLREQV